MGIDEIVEFDFLYLADVLIYADITTPALKGLIYRVGRRLVGRMINIKFIEGF